MIFMIALLFSCNLLQGNDIDVTIEAGNLITFKQINPSSYGKNGDSFYLSETEITNKQFKAFLDSTGLKKGDEAILKMVKEEKPLPLNAIYEIEAPHLCWVKNDYPKGKGDHPVVLISLRQAVKFCDWLNKNHGKRGMIYRLPTYSEWLVAAYGGGRNYPWGNEPRHEAYKIKKENLRQPSFTFNLSTESVKARTHGVSPEGILGLWGNVSELIIKDGDLPFKLEGVGADTIWMGGSYKDEKIKPKQTYWGYFHGPNSRADYIGFRVILCAKGQGSKNHDIK